MWGRDRCLGFIAGQDGLLDADHVAEIRASADLEQERLTRLGDLKSHAEPARRPPPERRRRAPARLLNEQTQQLAQLVNQLLDLSRLEADALELRKTDLPVRQTVEAIVTAVAPEHGDRIEVAVDPDLRTSVDPDGLDRIVANVGEDFVPRLFERSRADGSKKDGSGLGLAIAQSYANAHGARFELVLPRPHRGA